MSSFLDEVVYATGVEVKYTVLKQWWERHCQSFCTWYLTLNEEQQRHVLLKACPDLPTQSPFAREANGEHLLPTDLIMPELSLDSMLASQGRVFVLFITRRLSTMDLCRGHDLKLISDLYDKRILPGFAAGILEGMDTPFVDPTDPEERVRSLSPTTPPETRLEIEEHFKHFRLVRAELWLAVKIRRFSILSLIESLVVSHYEGVAVKPSPSYQQLLKGEVALQKVIEDEQTADGSGETQDNNEITSNIVGEGGVEKGEEDGVEKAEIE